MLPKWHILFGAIVSIILYYIFNLNFVQFLIIFFSSVLIDFDHYLFYIFVKKDFNLRRAHKWFIEKTKKFLSLSKNERRFFKNPILIFHGIEFWIILGILSIFYHFIIFIIYHFIIFIIIGIAIHMFIDFIEIIYLKEPLYPKFSQIYTFYRNKKKKELSLI